MGFDGIFLQAVLQEIKTWIGSRIDRIYQPAKEELILVLRKKGGARKLLLSANAGNARVHFTERPPQNPPSPPMFCMLLRKKIGGGRLIDAYTPGCDRVLYLDFEVYNELGDLIIYTVAAEIMGRHSNIIVFEKNSGKILDAIKRIYEEASQYRSVFPGLTYKTPPIQNKRPFYEITGDEIADILDKCSDKFTEDILVEHIQGVSPLTARELCGCYGGRRASELSLKELNLLKDRILSFKEKLRLGEFQFTMLLHDKRPKDFSCFSISQYGELFEKKTFPDTASLLDDFFFERERILHLKQQSGNLLHKIQILTNRAVRTAQIRQTELSKSKRRDEYRVYGDLLQANLDKMKKGMKEISVVNFYDQVQSELKIPLDPSKTPIENIQSYYKDYKKAANAEEKLKNLVEEAKLELEYLESVQDFAQRASSIEEITAIKKELAEGGYIKEKKDGKKTTERSLPFLQFRSSDGFIIYCGRNNKQNDILTFKKAAKSDLWFHTQKIRGSHVILVTKGETPPDRTIEEACVIAATYSKGKNGAQIPVDYTQVRYVKKPSGSKPGMSIFTDYKTAYVDPDEEFVKSLLVDLDDKKR